MRAILFAVVLATHGCQPGTTPLFIPDAHRVEIGRQLFAPVARIGDLPDPVQAALRELPGGNPADDLILAGCAIDHCLVHYEHRGLFYVVLLGMASRVRIEWAGLIPGPLEQLSDAKAMVLQPPVEPSRWRWW